MGEKAHPDAVRTTREAIDRAAQREREGIIRQTGKDPGHEKVRELHRQAWVKRENNQEK